MNHLIPKYITRHKKSTIERKGKYASIVIKLVYESMCTKKEIMPHIAVPIRYWLPFYHKAKKWRNLIAKELYDSILRGEVVQIPFFGECYAGRFVTDDNEDYASVAFVPYKKKCGLSRLEHYIFYPSYNLHQTIMNGISDGSMNHITRVLPIGEWNLKEYMKEAGQKVIDYEESYRRKYYRRREYLMRTFKEKMDMETEEMERLKQGK